MIVPTYADGAYNLAMRFAARKSGRARFIASNFVAKPGDECTYAFALDSAACDHQKETADVCHSLCPERTHNALRAGTTGLTFMPSNQCSQSYHGLP